MNRNNKLTERDCEIHHGMKLTLLNQDLKSKNIFMCSQCFNDAKVDEKYIIQLDLLVHEQSQFQILKYYPFLTSEFSQQFSNLSKTLEENASFLKAQFDSIYKSISAQIYQFQTVGDSLNEFLNLNLDGFRQAYYESSDFEKLMKTVYSQNESTQEIELNVRKILEQQQKSVYLQNFLEEIKTAKIASNLIKKCCEQIKVESDKLADLVKTKIMELNFFFGSHFTASRDDIQQIFVREAQLNFPKALPLSLIQPQLLESQNIIIQTTDKFAKFTVEGEKQALVYLEKEIKLNKAYKLKVKFNFPNGSTGRNVLIKLNDLEILEKHASYLMLNPLNSRQHSVFDFDTNIIDRGDSIQKKVYSKESFSFEIRLHIEKSRFYVADEGYENINRIDEKKKVEVTKPRLSILICQSLDSQMNVTITDFFEIDPSTVNKF